jgi:hypothetical protein
VTGRFALALPWALAAACLSYDPSALAASPKRSIGLLFALALLAHRLAVGAPLRLHRAAFTLLGCVLLLGISALYGAAGRWLVLGNWWLIGALLLGLSAFDQGTRKGILGRTALLVSLGVSLALWFEWVFGARLMQLHAGQGNPNWAGLLLAAAWLAAFNDGALDRVGSAARALFSALIASALVLSASRVAWVAAALAWLVVLAWKRSRREAAVNVALLGAAIALSNVHLGAAPEPRSPAAVAHKHTELDRSAKTSLAGRVWIQRIALRTAIDELPLGTGLGGFFPAFLEQQGKALATLSPRSASQRFSNATTAHQDFIELWVEAGPLAPLLFLLGFALALRSSDAYSFGTLVVIALCALGDSPLHLPALGILLAALFAALPEQAELSRPKSLFALVLLVNGFLLARSLAEWTSERCASKARSATGSERQRLLERGARLSPDSSERALELGVSQRERGDLRAARESLRRATSLGGDVASYVALGAIELDASNERAARDAFDAALARNPGSVRAHSGQSEALRRLGDLDDAERHAKIAAELLPGDMELRARLDSIREQRWDRELYDGAD